ncbi:hypothetical protein [Lihuaxuella thermophila]|uniref:Uncharacterized protein n=1 Tax=Lihuaxuella thermophila TaxID=1173111 RepID=A0A1H8F4K0_9BACL|nr:hypothetical protein [Lihuaxuella thermophila]SEN26546.1 hypothetical protein SAMN05444955_1086 [Lihuaxuella thermophila]
MLRLRVDGKCESVNHFMQDLKAQPQYQLLSESRLTEEDHRNNADVTVICYLDDKPTQRKVCNLSLSTSSGREVKIEMLDCQIVEMGDGVTYIRGKVFDIFG